MREHLVRDIRAPEIRDALIAKGWIEDKHGNLRSLTNAGRHIRVKFKARVVLIDVDNPSGKRRLRIGGAYYTDCKVDAEGWVIIGGTVF